MSELQRAYFDAIQRDNRPTVRDLADTVQIARVVHTCDACSGLITPGEEYRRIVLIVDGDLSTEKFHTAPCIH